MTAILVILLVILFFRYLFPRLILWYGQRKMRQFAENMFGAAGNPAGNRNSSQRRQEDRGFTAVRKKKISRDVGEYVAFEELPPEAGAPGEEKRVEVHVESQIEDAVWEDIE